MAGRAMRGRIGIIGGMGPEATVLLMQRIIERTIAADDADHVPMIVDNNPQVPSRIAALIEKRGEDPGPVIAAMAANLEAFGAQALAMPCNTAHHYADRIRAATSVPFLDMVKMSVERMAGAARPGTRVGMLASPAVRITGLFDKAVGPSGPELLYLDDDAPLLDLIRHIKRRGGDDAARECLSLIARRLIGDGAALLLVACSELSLISHALPDGVEVIDTIDVLAEACVAFSTFAEPHSREESAA